MAIVTDSMRGAKLDFGNSNILNRNRSVSCPEDDEEQQWVLASGRNVELCSRCRHVHRGLVILLAEGIIVNIIIS
jgi:hypothetical protein